MNKEKITFKEFLDISNRLEIRIGKIISAKRIPKKDKLIELSVTFEFSEPENFIDKPLVCVTNLGEFFEPEDFINGKLPFITNLEPVKLGGVVSEVMLMVANKDEIVSFPMENFEIGGNLM